MVNFTILGSGYAAAITAFNFDSAANTLSILNTTATSNSPSWLAHGPTGSVIASLETTPGGLESFTLGDDFSLTTVSRTDSGGIPVTVAVLSSGTEAVTANYDTGLIVSYPIDADGVTLGEGINGTTLVGSGPVAGRQDSPHAHHIIEYNDEVLVADLGSDMIWRLQKDAEGAYQVAGKVVQKAGSGPRHIAAVKGKVFVASELDNSLSAYLLPELAPAKTSAKFRRACTPTTPPTDDTDSQLIGSLSVLPEDPPAGATWGAGELILSPDEKFIYVSNRNVGTTDERGDPIAIFTADPLKLVGHQYTNLTHVRGMIFGGDNSEYLVAAGQNAGGVVVYSRGDDGTLSELARYAGETEEETKGIATLLWL